MELPGKLMNFPLPLMVDTLLQEYAVQGLGSIAGSVSARPLLEDENKTGMQTKIRQDWNLGLKIFLRQGKE